jgi:hypothetical protein
MKKIIKIILTAIFIFMFLLTAAGCFGMPTLAETYVEQESYEETFDTWFIENLLYYLQLEGLNVGGHELNTEDIIEISEKETRREVLQEHDNFYDFLNMVYHEGPSPNYSAEDLSVFQGLGEYSEYIEESSINLRETDDKTSESSEQESIETENAVEEQTQENISTYQEQLEEGCMLTVNVDNSTSQVNGSIDFDRYIGDEYRTSSLEFDSTLEDDNSFEAIASGMIYSDGEPVGDSGGIDVKGKISDDGASMSGTIYDPILKNTFTFLALKVSSIKETARTDLPTGIWEYKGMLVDADLYLTINYDTGIASGSIYWKDETGEFSCILEGIVDLATAKITLTGETQIKQKYWDWYNEEQEVTGEGETVLIGQVIKLGLRVEGTVQGAEEIYWYADALRK